MEFIILSQDFFLSNLYWIIGVTVILLLVLSFLLSHFLPHKTAKKVISEETKSTYLASLGGADNVVSHQREGSRIVLTLKDYSKIDKKLLEQAGVTGFIEKSDKLTLVVKNDAESVYASLFPAESGNGEHVS